MEKINRTRFLDALKYAKNTVSKEDILRIGEECGIVFSKRISRDNAIDKIAEENFKMLHEAFKEFLYIPVWNVADHYGLSTEKINKLCELGIIKEQPKEQKFYSRQEREYYTAFTYPLEVLNYDTQYLQSAYEEAYGAKGNRVRLETKSEEEAIELIREIDKIFNVTSSPDIYAHRNQDGYYSYFTIKKLNNSLLEKTAQRLEIDKLNNQIKKLKTEHKEEIGNLKDKVAKELGIPKFSIGQLISVKNRLDKLNQQNNQLKEEIEKLKESRSKAGRKRKLTPQDQEIVKVMKLRGDSVRKIAEHYGVGVATIDRILNPKTK